MVLIKRIKSYRVSLVICCFTFLFLAYSSQDSIASSSQSSLQSQCFSFPNVAINGNSNNENGKGNEKDGPSGLKIQVHLTNQNVGNVDPLTIFIITSNGECAIANINPNPAGFAGQEKQLTFEFDSGVIDINEKFNACVETSSNFDFICVVGTNSPSKEPEKLFLDVPIKNENSFVN
jgi:hypothetical protein